MAKSHEGDRKKPVGRAGPDLECKDQGQGPRAKDQGKGPLQAARRPACRPLVRVCAFCLCGRHTYGII